MRASRAFKDTYLWHFSLESVLATHFALARAQVPQALGCGIPPGTVSSLKSMIAPKPKETRLIPIWDAYDKFVNDIFIKDDYGTEMS